jgi:anti-anti-sigma factor
MLSTGRSHFDVSLVVAGGVARVIVVGEVDLATAPDVCRRADVALATAGVSMLVVDLGSCSYLDSAGLHALEYVIERATERAAGVSVVAARDNVRLVIEIAGAPAVLDALCG